MNVLIVGSGTVGAIEIIKELSDKSDLLICADGGARYFYKARIMPDILLGDFDSINPEIQALYQKSNIEIIRFPSHKNYTDMELAIDCAIEKGASTIYLVGAVGSRMDHTLSNIHLLHKITDAKAKGVIIDQNNYIYIVTDHIKLKRKQGFFVSLVPATPVVEGVTTKGLAYPLKDAKMVMGTGLGISNEFTLDSAEVSIKKGRLYVMVSKD
ncbi:MAG TPA: thiamine diphosphokinase [Thermoclostridium sp.]|nr:thiamine diphosphokinase [Thermoclostridium sp.]